jgi:hypothetical protein
MEFLGALQRHPRASPVWSGLSNTAPVPLSGFLNLSAASRQARVPRPCFMPQPFLGASLQSLPLTASVDLSRGHLLPRGSSPACCTHRSRPFAAGFGRLPRAGRGRLASPAGYELPFHGARPLPGCSGPRTTFIVRSAGSVHLGALFPLRVRSRRSGSPLPDGRCSPGFLPLQSSPGSLGSSTRPGTRPEHDSSPEGSASRLRGPAAPGAG